jgi:hypothetical protein
VGWGRPAWGARAALGRQVLAQYTRPLPERQEGTFRLPRIRMSARSHGVD